MLESILMVTEFAQQVQADTIGDLVSDITEFAGGYIQFVLLAVLGLINRYIVQVAKLVGRGADRLPGPVVATIAFATAQLIVFVNTYLVGFGAPELDEDPALLVTGLEGLVVWFVSMGWHGFLKELLGEAPVVDDSEDDTDDELAWEGAVDAEQPDQELDPGMPHR